MAGFVKRHPQIDTLVGLEARGWPLVAALTMKLQIKSVFVRKAGQLFLHTVSLSSCSYLPGKLPGKVKQVTYAKEYGKDSFEIRATSVPPGSRCMLVDDLLATGGSLACVVELVKQCGAHAVAAAVVVELKDLKGTEKLPVPVYSVISY